MIYSDRSKLDLSDEIIRNHQPNLMKSVRLEKLLKITEILTLPKIV